LNAGATIVAKIICKFTPASVHKKAPSRLFLAISSTDALSPALLSLLSDAERLKIEDISGHQRLKEYFCGRVMLRLLLQAVTGLPADRHTISTTDTGKPVCENGPGVSISHTKGVIACAAAVNGDVGVDIEFTDSSRDTGRLATEYFSPTEIDWLSAQPRNRFYMLWVLKEAWLKAVGTGIAGGIGHLQCRINPPCIDARLDHPINYRLNLFEMSGAYVGLATTDTEDREITVLQLDPGTQHLTRSTWLRKVASGDSHGGASPSEVPWSPGAPAAIRRC
jgi:4'-phosphopantetheinyl transferase